MKSKRYFLRSTILFILVLTLSINFIGCNNKRQSSVLHDEDSSECIKYSSDLMEINIKSPQGFIYDVGENKIIYTKGQDKVVYPGSITKLLTVLFAIEILPLDEVITPKDEVHLIKSGSSIAYIKENHRITVEMLIEGILLPSGNDAAYVLAAACGRTISKNPQLDGASAVKLFMDELDKYGKKIGLCGTHFTDPDGYAESNHYTTTEDMLIIAKSAYKNPIIMKYASMYEDSVVYESGHTNTWINTNRLINKSDKYYSEYVTGIKTGSIDNEYSLVFSFDFKDGREYIAGVFGADYKNTRFEDALKIIENLKL